MSYGTYFYSVFRPYFQKFTYHNLRVEIVGESDKSFKVKYLEPHENGNRVGYITWVSKRKVRLDKRKPVVDMENIRLPYID